MSSGVRVIDSDLPGHHRHLWRWPGRALALPCAGAMVFWLVSISIVSGMDGSMLDALAGEKHANPAAVQVAGARRYEAIHWLLSLEVSWVSEAFWLGLRISLVTALTGGGIGLLLAYGIARNGAGRTVYPVLVAWTRIARYVAVPLAFASTPALGHSGLVTSILNTFFGASLIRYGITSGGVWALSLTYAVLELPLLLLSLAAVLVDLHPASGATTRKDYWYRVALPRLTPALVATTILLFANTMGAQVATCAEYGCERTSLPYLLVDGQRTGDVPADPVLGYALAIRMVLIMAIGLVAYAWIQTMSERGKTAMTAFLAAAGTGLLRALAWLLR